MRTVMIDGAEVMMPESASGAQLVQATHCPKNKFVAVVRNSNGVPMRIPVQNSSQEYEMMDGDRVETMNRVRNGCED